MESSLLYSKLPTTKPVRSIDSALKVLDLKR